VLVAILVAACGGGSPAPAAAPRSTAAAPDASPAAAPADAAAAGAEQHILQVRLDPARFAIVEQRPELNTLRELAANRLLEFHKLPGAASGCSEQRVPDIGPVTATTRLASDTYNGLTRIWFQQRSSVDHTPVVGAGFYVCRPTAMIVIRYVGTEPDMTDAAPALERLLAEGLILLK
jgi:hypothetical protein